MLCGYCKSFNYDQLVRANYLHHKTWSDLVASGENGCEICLILTKEYQVSQRLGIIKNEPGAQIQVSSKNWGGGFVYFGWATPQSPEIVLQATTTDGDAFRDFFPSRPVRNAFLLEDSISHAKAWLRECSTTHTDCPSVERRSLPTRVIDVGSEALEPRLVVSDKRTKGQWIALSHCWGSCVPIKSTTASLKEHCKRLSLENLPKTYREAVLLARGVGIQYLWIDSLCILQDSKKDWLAEASQMAYIYENAVFTISAESSTGSSGSMLGSINKWKKKKYNYKQAECYSDRLDIKGTVWLKASLPDYTTTSRLLMQRGPLGSRGWTLQEEILSPRVLQFHTLALVWRCNQSRADNFDSPFKSIKNEYDESQVGILPCYTHIMAGSTQSPEPEEITGLIPYWGKVKSYWYASIINDYSNRKLTFASDKPIAVAGIARAMQVFFGGSKYKAGIWQNDWCTGLFWVCDVQDCIRVYRGLARRLEHVPTWSWASIDYGQVPLPVATPLEAEDGPIPRIEMYHDYRCYLEALAEAEFSVVNANNDPFGDVISGTLTFQGGCCEACSCRFPRCYMDVMEESDLDQVWDYKEIAEAADLDWEELQHHQIINNHSVLPNKRPCRTIHGYQHTMLTCIKIGKLHSNSHDGIICLILKPLQGFWSKKYTRVGLIRFRHEKQWPVRKVVVV